MYKYLFCFFFTSTLFCMEQYVAKYMQFTVVNASELSIQVSCEDKTKYQEKKDNKVRQQTVDTFAKLLKETGDHVGFSSTINPTKQKIVLTLRLLNKNTTLQIKRLSIEFIPDLIGSITVRAKNNKMNIETAFHQYECSEES